jgi:membrane associated rhomboid family serine protease
LNNVILQIQDAINLIKQNIPLTLWILAGLWIIFIINAILQYRLNIFGVYPRHFWGLVGIVFHPLLHGSFNHIFFNSLPLFVLIDFTLINGLNKFLCITISIVLISGTAVWLFGRRAIHIGASGLIMGYWSYLLVNAYQHPSVSAFILAIVCCYYFGGLLFNLFPTEEKTSWEGHVFGFLAGLVSVYLCPLGFQGTPL